MAYYSRYSCWFSCQQSNQSKRLWAHFKLLVGVGRAILGGWLLGQLGISIGTSLLSTLINAFIGVILLLLPLTY